MKICDLKLGEEVTLDLVLTTVIKAQTKATKFRPASDFLNATFSDGAATIKAVFWNFSASCPTPGAIYTISATVTTYDNALQLTLKKLSLATDQNMARFSNSLASADYLWAELEKRISAISNDKLRTVTSSIYNKYKEELLTSTSAKSIHHVGVGGNAIHAIEVHDFAADIAAYIATVQKREVSIDLVRAGSLLHDIGKPFVYQMDGPAISYTMLGNLHEHIVRGIIMLEQALLDLGEEYRPQITLLQHIIASHHGQLEYGSPVTPKCIEAYIINIADNISVTTDVLYTANAKAIKDGKNITDKLFTLNNYEHILQSQVAELLRK